MKLSILGSCPQKKFHPVYKTNKGEGVLFKWGKWALSSVSEFGLSQPYVTGSQGTTWERPGLYRVSLRTSLY